MITQEILKKFFNYDPCTGLFTRLTAPCNKVKIGDIAGSIDNGGYIRIVVNSKYYRAHRLAVLYMTGKFPENEVDHIDGIRSNNKWNNLREANKSQNGQNIKKDKNNKSTGLLGSYSHPHNNGTFVGQIVLNRKQYYLGVFKTAEEAHNAYIKAKRELHEFGTL